MSVSTCSVDVMLSSLAAMNEAERAALISSARSVWERAYPGKHRGRAAGKRRWVSGRPLKSSGITTEKLWLLKRRQRLARALGSPAEGAARDTAEIMAASARNAGDAWTAKHEAAANKLSSKSNTAGKRKPTSAATDAAQKWKIIKRARQTAHCPQLSACLSLGASATDCLPNQCLTTGPRPLLSLDGRICFVDSSARSSPICAGSARPQILQALERRGARLTTNPGQAACFVVDDVNSPSPVVLWNSRLRGIPVINEAHARCGHGPAVCPEAAITQGKRRIHVSHAFRLAHPDLAQSVRCLGCHPTAIIATLPPIQSRGDLRLDCVEAVNMEADARTEHSCRTAEPGQRGRAGGPSLREPPGRWGLIK